MSHIILINFAVHSHFVTNMKPNGTNKPDLQFLTIHTLGPQVQIPFRVWCSSVFSVLSVYYNSRGHALCWSPIHGVLQHVWKDSLSQYEFLVETDQRPNLWTQKKKKCDIFIHIAWNSYSMIWKHIHKTNVNYLTHKQLEPYQDRKVSCQCCNISLPK
jgi:hypothetical protein